MTKIPTLAGPVVGMAVLLLVLSGCANRIGESEPDAVAKAVEFLAQEVPAWSLENGCFSCHNNGDAARALLAAEQAGYRVPPGTLTDTLAWVEQPDRWDQNKGDPGFSDKRLADLQFAATLAAALDTGRLRDKEALQQAVRRIVAEQGSDGAWQIGLANPVGSPATYGTALATAMALGVLNQAAAAGPSIDQATRWFADRKPVNVPTAAALLMVAGMRSSSTEPPRADCIDFIRQAQTADGGWGPYADSPPEPFDTALALLALGSTSASRSTEEIVTRGRGFLEATQLPDGSWPATTRPPGGHSYAQQISTTGWATLALLATGPSRNIKTRKEVQQTSDNVGPVP